MRNTIRKFTAVAVAALLALMPMVATAQVFGFTPLKVKYYGVQRIAADVEPAMYIKFVGVEADATAATTVAVVAGGAITFIKDGVAYNGFECPVSGALGGIIDQTNAACDTLGEVVDSINSDIFRNFVAVIAAGLRSDDIKTNQQLLAVGASTLVKNPTGLAVPWDTSSSDDEEIGLWDYSQGILNWVPPGVRRVPSKSAFNTSDSVMLYGWEQFTNAGAFQNVTVYCVVEDYVGKSEVVTVLHSQAAAATTVAGVVNALTAIGGWHCQGGKLFFRTQASGADTSVWNTGIYGYRAELSQ